MSDAAKRRLVGALVAGLIVAAVLGLVSRRGGTGVTTLPASGTVTYVYDGDTVEVPGVGKVRLIGIDALDGRNLERMTSQSQHYGMPVQRVKHWAARATQFARGELTGRRVTLHYEDEVFDVYGRVLAYVHVPDGEEEGDADFNLLMLKTGLAAAYGRFDHARRGAYVRAEAQARAQRIGLWQDARYEP